MNKFGRRKIALALACASVFGGKTQATNINNPQSSQPLEEVEGDASGNKNLKNKISTPPKDLPKKFYPLWIALSALGLSAVAILGILGIKKLCSKDSGDQGETPNGPFYYGLCNYGSIEDLKKAWGSKDVIGGDGPDRNSPIGKELVKLITDKKEFGQFLDQDHKRGSELASIEGDELLEQGYNFFSKYAEIRFDDKGSFECYDNKGKKLNLLPWERFFIDYIAKYTKQKLGILPCMVEHDGGHCFYFIFSFDASSEDFKKDVCINYDKHTLLNQLFGSHISLGNMVCELNMWGKKTN